ncbi:lon protease homolog 2, peroxisomal-like isoform X1 [Olea europaea subsp. europaea]|uniref:Lon protease homolog 2, peroxisomal-like isoform X1 n=1 Tax=Olea europaea subsp. europaea TaxID=158383 RepID=A0A8S0QAS1_OLEEU|nr:lon protease homolog 2, peroxisomal-like isoform X1 [Olea europaea subsp. europaea]
MAYLSHMLAESGRPVSDGDGEMFFWLLLLLPSHLVRSSLLASAGPQAPGCRSTVRPLSPQKSPFLWLCTPQLHYGATLARGLWLAPSVGNDLGAYNSSRVYLDLLADLPWQKASEEHELDLKAAKDHLDSDHYGLVKIKHRIIEYLAVRKLKPDARGPVLCFVGPPGVGKTSLGYLFSFIFFLGLSIMMK